jgi:hypothetical protein
VKLVGPLQRLRLATEPDDLGLSCGPEGLRLAGAPLLLKTEGGFLPRPLEEVEALVFAAYGALPSSTALFRGLRAAAAALNQNDQPLAMTVAVHLGLAEFDREAARRVGAVDSFLRKYDPDEPRDWRGRWTTGGASPAED